MCTTTTHYETHISTECSVGGSAQCDGYCVDHGEECTCSCHHPWVGDDMPTTVQGMRDWHDEENGVLASVSTFDINSPEDAIDLARTMMAEAEAKAAEWEQRDPEHREVLAKIVRGQDRLVVVNSYVSG